MNFSYSSQIRVSLAMVYLEYFLYQQGQTLKQPPGQFLLSFAVLIATASSCNKQDVESFLRKGHFHESSQSPSNQEQRIEVVEDW